MDTAGRDFARECLLFGDFDFKKMLSSLTVVLLVSYPAPLPAHKTQWRDVFCRTPATAEKASLGLMSACRVAGVVTN